MNRLVGSIVIASGIGLVPDGSASLLPYGNEVTVYMLSCDGKPVSGVCPGNEKTDVPMTYRVLADQHSVSYWRVDDPGEPQRFPFCAVSDTKSWWCQWEEDEVPKSRFGMVAGKYVEIATCMSVTTTQLYYQVPMWRWWLVWLHERLA